MLTAAAATASPIKPSTAANGHAPTRRECPVTVAVRIRPPLGSDPLSRSAQASAVTQVEDRNQVAVHHLDGDAPRAFTFDHVFGPTATQDEVYDMCARQLLEPVAQGFNATVLAYGQTGTGKTFTMGTCPTGGLEHENLGIAPRLIEALLDMLPDVNQRLVRVSYIELYQEQVRDLLSQAHDGPEVVIREDRHGNITMQGVSQVVCQTKEDILGLLERGSQERTVGETNMNSTSSRSHAIFSIMLEQYVLAKDSTVECKMSKLHLVDLAGSERQKRTGADGVRFKESIKINSGLLALGNVINALASRTESAHVRYRDSKLTRLLQDSLGGNSRTIMIACVSPVASNAQESLNTLVYANRAKNIKNRPVPNIKPADPPPAPPTAPPLPDPPTSHDDDPSAPHTPTVAPDHSRPHSQWTLPETPAVLPPVLDGLMQQLTTGLAHAHALVSDLQGTKALARAVGAYLRADRAPTAFAKLAGLLAAHDVVVHDDPLVAPALAPALAELPPLPTTTSTRPPSVVAALPPPPPPQPPEFDAHEAEWRYRKLEAQLFDTTAANEKLQVQVTDLRSQLDSKSRALAQLQARVKEAEDLVQYYQVKADEAEMRVKRRENEVEQYQAELEEGAGELEAAARDIARLKEEVRGLQVVVQVEKFEVGTMAEEGDVPVNEAAVAGVAAELVGIEQEMERKLQMIQELDQSRQRTDNLSKKFQDKMTRLERELHATEKLVEKLKSEKLDMDSEKNKLRHDYETKICDITAQLHALRSRQKQHDKLLKEKEANGRQIQELQSEVATLRDKEAALKRKAKSDTDKLASAEHIYAKEIAQLQRQHDDDLRKIKILEAQVHSLRKRSGGANASPSRASSSAPSVPVIAGPAPPPLAPPVAEIEELKAAFERQIEQLRQERDQQAAQVQELEHYRINNKELRLKLRELMRSAKNGANGIAVMEYGAASNMDTAHAAARHAGTSTPAMTSV
ncbi:hypothetical protein AMAG_04524 [Allomyces macrogynus ATCC 38327]|uniref:Kinesin-like protein n=1 Tax=Allomyces macrogynus (strain ATCC 38327) TaxID=578462 RepID=A0A0L0S5G6_ALLM3|nr:hypothetical protein AMAG_04524 [Allomyces macrogynus ATCC 38327]|eukprot:KNE57661.1 hypothetical protein AMAG_04524 [Allomyces macrogynus ATCC 38327]